ncbi:glycosyltransferase family A protein [Lysinibacillus xylanilyticus]|uniref:glycosyltransferase family A protein n=1 Tax=Lysinibacillus xylanilyticus TaxID=582475 RepID=UPI003D0253D1
MCKVSIIMPCFNDGEYIKESIESVLSQTYKEIELIIINDGSTDELTNNILNNLSHPNIKIFTTSNIGPSAARNFGISKSTGKYILPVDADDLIHSLYIEECVKQLNQNDNVGIVYCYAELFGEQTGRWDLPEYSFEKMLLDNIIFVTSMFRKKDWEIIGGFNENLVHGMEDYDFWLSILELEREVVQLKEVYFYYRIKKVSRTTKFSDNSRIVKDTYKTLYLNHSEFYRKYSKEYAMILRDSLIEQIYINKKLTDLGPILNKVKRMSKVKRFIKKILIR